MKRKLVVVINGKGGVGKDTFCDFVSEKYRTLNISTITPVKEIARRYGWSGEKDKKSRKFLADLKRIFIEYNDLPNSYAFQEYKKFLEGDKEIMIRLFGSANRLPGAPAQSSTAPIEAHWPMQ